jgi:hypothetical protein
MVMRRRVGRPLLRTAVVGGAAYAAGHSAAKSAAQESDQNQRLAELEQQAAYQQPAPYPSQAAYPPQATPYPPQAGYPPPASMPAPSAATEQAAASAPPDRITQLKMLADLRASGVLNDQEFETEKRRILQQS